MILLFLVGCPVAMADDYPDTHNKCVIDSCDNEVCIVETPEGWVEVEKKCDYKEGVRIVCPLWLIEPT